MVDRVVLLLRRLLLALALAILISVLPGQILFLRVLPGRSRPRLLALARSWSRLLLRCAGIEVEMKGIERLPEGGAVFLANHRSNLDGPIVITSIERDMAFIIKKELLRIPSIGYFFKSIGAIPVERSGDGRDRDRVEGAISAMQGNQLSILLFPEGTRSRSDEFLPLKKGGAIIALRTGRPIVPLAISGSGALFPKKSLLPQPGLVRLEALEPIPTAGLTVDDRDQLMLRVETALKNAYVPGRIL